MKINYEEDVKIDKYNLDELWQEHPSKVWKYGKLWARQTAIMNKQQDKCDRLQDKLKEVYAKLENKLRFSWKEYGFLKPPAAGAVDSWCIVQDEYKEKQREIYENKNILVDERERDNKLKFAYYTVSSNQKTALENEVRLYLREYYSDLKEEDHSSFQNKEYDGNRNNSNYTRQSELPESNSGMKPRKK